MKKLNIAIIGQGRSGRDIHGSYMHTDPAKEKFNVVAIVDELEFRREIAKKEWPEADIYSDYTSLFGRTDIDLVVNSTYSYMHTPVSIDLLNHGFNVLCEKPIAGTVAELDSICDAAKAAGKYFNIFQQSRLAPYFVKIKEVIKSGVLGDIVEIDTNWGGFSRRYDWQTLQCYTAGNLLNTGPHPMDQVLNLLDMYDKMPNVFCDLRNTTSYGDAEDYCKVILTAENKPLVQVTITSAFPYPKPAYEIHATRGGLTATFGKVCWKYYLPEEAPELKLTKAPIRHEDGTPAYCSDNLTWHEEEYETPGDGAFTYAVAAYYEMTYDALVNGKTPEILPYQVRQQIAIAEMAHKSNPLPVKFER